MSPVPGTPLQRQHTPWRRWAGADMRVLGVHTQCWVRTVDDGQLRSLVAHEPQGWHLSISFVDHFGQPSRYPSWDEIAHARYELVPSHVTMAMLLPPPHEYVDRHMSTFHLHEIPGEQ